MQLECWIPQVLPFETPRESDFFEPPSFLPLDNLGATCSRGPYRRSPVCMMHENRRDLLDLLTHTGVTGSTYSSCGFGIRDCRHVL